MDMFSSYFASFSDFVLFSGRIPVYLQPRHSMSLSAVCPGKMPWDIGCKSHPKDLRGLESNPRPLVYKASSFNTTLRKLLGING